MSDGDIYFTEALFLSDGDIAQRCVIHGCTVCFWQLQHSGSVCLLPTATRHIRYTNDDIDNESRMKMTVVMVLLNSQKLGNGF